LCSLGQISKPISKILMLKSTGPKTDHWGTPLTTVLCLDVVPYNTILCLWPSNQSLIHRIAHPSNPYLSHLVLQVRHPQCRAEGQEWPPSTCWPYFLLMQPRIQLAFWAGVTSFKYLARTHCLKENIFISKSINDLASVLPAHFLCLLVSGYESSYTGCSSGS